MPIVVSSWLNRRAVTFKRFGIGVKWVTEPTPEAFAAAIDEKTKAIYVESIANPKYIVSNIPVLAKVDVSLKRVLTHGTNLPVDRSRSWHSFDRGQYIWHWRCVS